jgi:chemotaxis signal transduction protein
MVNTGKLVVFALEGQRYALALACVSRVVRAVAVTPVPHAPAGELGIINVQGEVLPVVDARWHFGLPSRGVRPGDRFIIATLGGRAAALVVDAVEGTLEPGGARRDVAVAEGLAAVVDPRGETVLLCGPEAFGPAVPAGEG